MNIWNIIHWLLFISIVFSSFVLPKGPLKFAFAVNVLIFISWLLFDRCIAWDIEKAIDPSFSVAETSTRKLLNIDMDLTTYNYITHTLIYINMLFGGYRLGILKETIVSLLAYIVINGKYLHRSDDELSKYETSIFAH